MSEKGADRPSRPIRELLQPIRGWLVISVALAAVGAVLTLVPLAAISHMATLMLGADGIVPPSALESTVRGELWWTVAIALVCLFAGLGLVTLSEFLVHLADNRLTRHLRLSLARRLARVPLGWFTGRASGEVKQAVQDDIGALHELTAHYYTTLGRCVGAIGISVIYLFWVDWRLAIVSLLPFPCHHLMFGAAKKSISEERMREFVAGQTRINNAVVEFVHGIPVVKAFGATGKAHGRYREAVDDYLRAFLNFTQPLVGPLANANALIAPVTVLGIVLVAGTLMVLAGWIEPLAILPFALVAPGISGPFMLLSFLEHGVANATGAAQRIQTLLDTPALEAPPGGGHQQPAGSEVRFESVGYAYDGENKVISDVSFNLAPGTVTAIVGASGAGKSTLARLLLRFFDPTEGRITLGGVDLRDIEFQELYRRVGFVLQEVRLIHASVRDNIALGKPSASQQDIEAAARAANIHERIMALPRGYDSVVGEDVSLSGGEEQRVSIARAILLDPPLLVLDEATAAADAESEAAVQEALSRFARGRALLVIAHRLDTVMHADRILVVEDGSLREQGDHHELLARDGRYARLWRSGGYHRMETEGELA